MVHRLPLGNPGPGCRSLQMMHIAARARDSRADIMPKKSPAINEQSLDGSKSGRSIASVYCTNDNLDPLWLPSARRSVASPRCHAVPSRQSIHPGRRVCPRWLRLVTSVSVGNGADTRCGEHRVAERQRQGHFILRYRRRHHEGPKESPMFL